MNIPLLARFARYSNRLMVALAAVVISAVLPQTASAGPNDVAYLPLNQSIEGIMPYSSIYTLNVRSPANFPVGVTRSVNLELTATSFSVGDEATALSYVSFLDVSTLLPVTQITFTAPNQVKSVAVRVSIPLLGISGSGTAATFAFHIETSNWGLMSDGSEVIDGGSNINAIASIDPAGDPNRLPPLVSITTPTDGQVFTPVSLPTTIPLSFVATARAGFPILNVDATLDGTPLTVTSAPNADSTNVVGTSSLVISAPGTYTVRVNAHNLVGDATDANTFTVVFGAPPVAVITSPLNGTNYNILAGGSGVTVPFTFTGTSLFGGITALEAKVDGVPVSFTTSPMGELIVTGQASLPYTAAGAHVLTVTATNISGTSQVATSNFTVTLVSPTPTIAITLTNGATYTVPSGGTSVSVPFTIASATTAGFKVDAVTASWSGSAPTLTHTPALGTAAAVSSSGTLLNVTPGTYTISATTTSSGVTATTSTSFTVNAAVQQPLPTVVINTPAAGSTYTMVSGGSVSIPLTFTGTSNATAGVITALTAKVDTTTLGVTSTTLGQKIANGAATMTITTTGTHTITVTARDAYGIATATRTFTVTVVAPKNVCGTVFYDVDADGTMDCAEFGLGSVTVNLVNSSGQVVATKTTNSCGSYTFASVAPGSYSVVVVPYAGLKPTTTGTRAITVSTSNVSVSAIGLGLNFAAIRTMTANGFTIGYWKNNLDKAITGKTSGIQVPASTLSCYTSRIGDFALSPYDCISMKTASSTMGSSSSAPKDLLSKQLVASEYNYQNAAYIGGNKNLTFVFLWWGEYVLKNSSSYSSTYLNWTKNWFDAYNNSHGGVVAGPN